MIGIDLVEVDRIKDEMALFDKIGLDKEKDYVFGVKNNSLRKQKLATLFCIKEAVMKALALGEKSGVSFKDICLFHCDDGKPMVELFGVAKNVFDGKFFGKKIEVSISHTKSYVIAAAMICDL